MLRLFNPTDQFITLLTEEPEQEYVVLQFDPRSVELYERCPDCHKIIINGYCFCDWLQEPKCYEANPSTSGGQTEAGISELVNKAYMDGTDDRPSTNWKEHGYY